MNIELLEVGGLYTTENKRKEAIELFNNPHYAYERDNMYTNNVLLPNDYFVVLETKVIHNSHFCLKLLTISGIVDWTSKLQFDEYYNPYYFKQVTQP